MQKKSQVSTTGVESLAAGGVKFDKVSMLNGEGNENSGGDTRKRSVSGMVTLTSVMVRLVGFRN